MYFVLLLPGGFVDPLVLVLVENEDDVPLLVKVVGGAVEADEEDENKVAEEKEEEEVEEEDEVDEEEDEVDEEEDEVLVVDVDCVVVVKEVTTVVVIVMDLETGAVGVAIAVEAVYTLNFMIVSKYYVKAVMQGVMLKAKTKHMQCRLLCMKHQDGTKWLVLLCA